MKKKEEIKPCPFCGGGCCVCEDPGNLWLAHCMDCDCSISTDKDNLDFLTREQAIQAWNTRKG